MGMDALFFAPIEMKNRMIPVWKMAIPMHFLMRLLCASIDQSPVIMRITTTM